MSIRPIDMNNIYLRMGEVAREQEKEVKKEEREQSAQNHIQKFREETFDHIVSQARESHADQTIREHEERNLPPLRKYEQGQHRKEHSDQREQASTSAETSAQDLALPMVTLTEDVVSVNKHPTGRIKESLDPDLGHHINIES